jgi:hypothetical protein
MGEREKERDEKTRYKSNLNSITIGEKKKTIYISTKFFHYQGRMIFSEWQIA